MCNVEKNIVWHEMGHLFGSIIANRLGECFGELQEVSFIEEIRNNPYVKFDKTENEFSYERSPHDIIQPCKIKDFYGYNNIMFLPQDKPEIHKRLEDAVKNKRKLFIYFFYLISGGLFNVYSAMGEKPLEEDDLDSCFDNKCFLMFSPGAGHDWDTCRIILGYGKFHLGKVIGFRDGCFGVLIRYNVFKDLENFIEKIQEKYCKKKLNKEESKQLYNDFSEQIESSCNIQEFVKEINEYIEKTISEIV